MTDQCEQAMMPVPKPLREGWDHALAEMAARGDDALLDEPLPTAWDLTQWTV